MLWVNIPYPYRAILHRIDPIPVIDDRDIVWLCQQNTERPSNNLVNIELNDLFIAFGHQLFRIKGSRHIEDIRTGNTGGIDLLIRKLDEGDIGMKFLEGISQHRRILLIGSVINRIETGFSHVLCATNTVASVNTFVMVNPLSFNISAS